ncbi:MAG: LacI family transcriptional regulator [Victivallales bacterium]|jgi:DNA-binding LacI/PurR family transcriptional regulator|nr:LacI family transcriptional regulator [Victivallales bacterium]
MVLRSGSCKTNFREIARELNLSPMTVYRVMNNEPTVRRETRTRVIDALNRHGYFTHKPQKNIKIMFDFTEYEYLTYYGQMLMQNVSKLNFLCYAVDHRREKQRFLDLAAVCEVAVFASNPDEQTITEAKTNNPDLYTINLSTLCNVADVTLSPNNAWGSELAAQHFYRMGHRHIGVYYSEGLTRTDRYKVFFAEMKRLDPDCRIDMIPESIRADTASVLRNYFNSTFPTAIFFLSGRYAEIFLHCFLERDPERFRDLSVMTFDNPQDLAFRKYHYDFDRIEFSSPDLLDWAEYYITNRPMMKKRSPIVTQIAVHLVTTGSVKPRRDINGIHC